MFTRRKLFIVGLFVPVVSLIAAQTITVGYGVGYDHETIQAAVASAAGSPGAVIAVADGIYTGEVIISQDVIVRSMAGYTNCLITGDAQTRGFRLQHTNAVIQGFTITNGRPFASLNGHGGGVYMTFGTLRDCLIVDNISTHATEKARGGGIYQNATHDPSSGNIALISNCTVRGNLCHGRGGSYCGGGVYIIGGMLQNCRIVDNCATGDVSGDQRAGGAQLLENSSMIDCYVISNRAYRKGGIDVAGGNVIISNTIIAHNQAFSDCGGLGINFANTRIVGGAVEYNTSGGYAGGVQVESSARAEIRGVTIRYNVGVYGGGGINALSGSKLNLSDCDILSNKLLRVSGAGSGAGISFYGKTAAVAGTVDTCRVIGNIISNSEPSETSSLCMGAGIAVRDMVDSLLINNCAVSDNITTNVPRACGGGIYANANTVVRNTLISGNQCWGNHVDYDKGGAGSGVYIGAAGLSNMIESCTIVNNYAYKSAGGIFMSGSGYDVVRNSIVAGNTAGNLADSDWYFGDTGRKTNVIYTCTPAAGIDWGDGCINADPAFAGPSHGNYRLDSGSQCINAGINQLDWMTFALDLDGRPRLDRYMRQVDMGCYEYIMSGTLFLLR